MSEQNKSTAAGHTAGQPVSNANKLEQHAPGPWVASWETGHIVSPAIKEAGKIVCTFPGTNAEGYRYANARLIVAAPELLEALENTLAMLELLNAPGTHDPIEARVYQARAAIARAKGN